MLFCHFVIRVFGELHSMAEWELPCYLLGLFPLSKEHGVLWWSSQTSYCYQNNCHKRVLANSIRTTQFDLRKLMKLNFSLSQNLDFISYSKALLERQRPNASITIFTITKDTCSLKYVPWVTHRDKKQGVNNHNIYLLPACWRRPHCRISHLFTFQPGMCYLNSTSFPVLFLVQAYEQPRSQSPQVAVWWETLETRLAYKRGREEGVW